MRWWSTTIIYVHEMPSKVKNISTSNEHKKSFQFSRSLSTFLIYSVSGAYIVIMWMIEKRRILYPHNFFPRLVHINFSLPFHFLCHFLLLPSKLIFSFFSLFPGEFIDFYVYMLYSEECNNSISWDDDDDVAFHL